MSGSPLDTPVFLVGAERSGTTLLRLMLDHHPEMAWCAECEFFVDSIADDGTPPAVDSYRESLAGDRVFQLSGWKIDRSLEFTALLRDFLRQKLEGDRKTHIGATVHRHFDRLLTVWPEARFIHLLRDGRDVARSCIGMGWSGNVWTGADRWVEAEKTWERLKSRLPLERLCEVRYEDLVRSPEETVTSVCSFLGVPFRPEMFDYAQSTRYEPADPSLIGQWRRKLTDWDIRLIEARIGTMLAARGYELSGLPPLEPNGFRRAMLRVQDRWFRATFRRKRFGFRLWAADLLARRLHARRWQEQVRSRLNAVENAQLR